MASHRQHLPSLGLKVNLRVPRPNSLPIRLDRPHHQSSHVIIVSATLIKPLLQPHHVKADGLIAVPLREGEGLLMHRVVGLEVVVRGIADGRVTDVVGEDGKVLRLDAGSGVEGVEADEGGRVVGRTVYKIPAG